MRISFILEKPYTSDIIKDRCPTGDKKEVFMLGIIGAMDEEVSRLKEQQTCRWKPGRLWIFIRADWTGRM